MIWIIELTVLFIAIGFMMARQASCYLWAATAGVAMAYWSVMHAPPTWALLMGWALFLPIARKIRAPYGTDSRRNKGNRRRSLTQRTSA